MSLTAVPGEHSLAGSRPRHHAAKAGRCARPRIVIVGADDPAPRRMIPHQPAPFVIIELTHPQAFGHRPSLGDRHRPPSTITPEAVNWGRSGPNEMITFNALRVLQAVGRLT